MVYGMFFCFYKLIKDVQNKNCQLHLFFNCLVTRGYSPNFLGPIFHDAQDYLKNCRNSWQNSLLWLKMIMA
jgi:hypothetical protein